MAYPGRLRSKSTKNMNDEDINLANDTGTYQECISNVTTREFYFDYDTGSSCEFVKNEVPMETRCPDGYGDHVLRRDISMIR